jgi:NTP pyrophosphatase (non-canonical NTP hydrolase)
MEKTIAERCAEVHKTAVEHGFYRNPPSRVKALMLMVTELAEACEADRRNDLANYREELADLAIRLFDHCAAEGIDLDAEVERKNAANKAREFKHGKAY